MPLKKGNPGSAANAYIALVIKEIQKDWMPTLGYGWQNASSVKEEVSKLLKKTGFSSGLTQFALNQWGIEGGRISGSPFAIIGTWAAMLDYYYDTIFESKQANTRGDLDRQVLWSQQSGDVYDKGFPDNLINRIVKNSTSHEELFNALRTAYLEDKEEFKKAQWKSLLNMGGPGENFIVANESDTTVSKPKDILKLGKTSQSNLQMELAEVDSYSSILNMAWLEDLYTRQKTPILMYNKLNVDELNAVRIAVRHRNEIIDVHFDRMLEDLGGDASPEKTFFYLFENLLQQFYQTLYVAKKMKGSKSTISRLEKVSDINDCLKISGLLKTQPGGKSNIALTGTGKEFFYLLAKGATPFICGEFFILSATPDRDSLAEKLAAIPINQKTNIKAYYQPLKEAPSYTRLISGNKDKIPFLLQGAEGIKKSLFSLAELPNFTEDSLSW